MNYQSKKTDRILPDSEIIELYWQRNEQAIDATDTKYGRYLFTIAYNIMRSDPDCEECLNDTYLSTWNAIPPARPNAFQVFLSKITRNIAIDKFREQSAEKRIPSELILSLNELDDCISDNYDEQTRAELMDIVRVMNAYLNMLSDRDAFVFICRYYYCDPVDTIAKMLKLSKNSIYRDLERMRSDLRERFAKEGINV